MSTSRKNPKRKPPEHNGWTHSGLILDLCSTLEQANDYICNEVYAGSRFLEKRPVPDVLRVRMSYTRPDFSIYEIKVSRADFMSDIRSDKWKTYLPYCSRFYFATPATGVTTIDDIPFVAGWMVRGPNGWRTAKTPKIRDFEPDFHYALALLISEQKHRWAAESRAEANKKLRHPSQVQWSEKMAARVKRVEEEIRDKNSLRNQLMRARTSLKENFNIDLEKYWMWDDAANKIRDMKTGISSSDVACIRRNLAQISKTLDEVAGPAKKED